MANQYRQHKSKVTTPLAWQTGSTRQCQGQQKI